MIIFLVSFLMLRVALSIPTDSCPQSAILIQTKSESMPSTSTYKLDTAFPLVSPTETFDALSIGFWVASSSAHTDFIQFYGDGNLLRLTFNFALTSITAKILINPPTSTSSMSGSTSSANFYWKYVSLSMNYTATSAILYVWDAGLEERSIQNSALNFATTQSWSFTTGGSKITLCSQPAHCGSNYTIAALSVYLNMFFSHPYEYQMYANPITPLAALRFSMQNYAIEQITMTNMALGVGSTPSYDIATNSLHFSSISNYIKWESGNSMEEPMRGLTFLMKLSYDSSGSCSHQKIFSRKALNGPEKYSIGFKSSLANGALVFSLTNSLGSYQWVIGQTTVFTNNDFHTVAISLYLYDILDKLRFTVSVNDSVPFTDLATPTSSGLSTGLHSEASTDEYWIGDNTCSFKGKLAYFYLWSNGGLETSMGCLEDCTLTMGPISDQRVCLDVCDSSCLTCNGTTSNDCLSCPATRLQFNPQLTTTFQCVFTCPTGFYPSEDNIACLPCDTSCVACTNGTGCTQCQSASPWMIGPSESLCYENCPPMTYQNSTLGRCLDCNSTCVNCTGPSSQECTSCGSDSYLNVIIGTENIGECVKCDSSCRTCIGPTSNHCTSCNSLLVLLENICCPQGYTSNGTDCIPPPLPPSNVSNTTDPAVTTAVTVSSAVLTSLSYAPTAAALVGQLASAAASSVSAGASAASSAFASSLGSYNLASYVALMKVASLFVLVNFAYRPRLLDFFKATVTSQSFPNFFSAIIGDSIGNKFTIGAFTRINFPCEFALNYGSYMSELLVYFGAASFFHILAFIFRKNLKIYSLLSKIVKAVYNMIVIKMIGSQIPFVMSVGVTFQSGCYKNNAEEILGLVMMIVMILLWLQFFAIASIFLFRGAQKNDSEREGNKSNGITMWDILTEGFLLPFVSDRLIRQVALPLNLIKVMCIALFIAIGQSNPYVQVVPAIVLQLGWLILDAVSDSKKSKIDLALNFLENLLVLMSFIACLCIGTVETDESLDFFLIGAIGSALAARTIHMIVGILGTIIAKLLAKKKPAADLNMRAPRAKRTHRPSLPHFQGKEEKSRRQSHRRQSQRRKSHHHRHQERISLKPERKETDSPLKNEISNISHEQTFEAMLPSKSKKESHKYGKRRETAKVPNELSFETAIPSKPRRMAVKEGGHERRKTKIDSEPNPMRKRISNIHF